MECTFSQTSLTCVIALCRFYLLLLRNALFQFVDIDKSNLRQCIMQIFVSFPVIHEGRGMLPFPPKGLRGLLGPG